MMRRRLHQQLWQGCVGAWHPGVDRSRSTILTDFSGFNNHGTLTLMDPATDWVTTEKGIALDFDGTSQYVTAKHGGQITVGNQYAISIWVKDTVGENASISREIWRETSNASSLNYNDRVGFAPSLRFVQRAGFGGPAINSTTALIVNQWQHIVGNYKSGLQELWVDGNISATGTTSFTLPFTSASTIIIGNTWLGRLADARIYNRTLTPSEIALLARRPGIAYETARRSVGYSAGAAPTGFQPAWAANSNSVIIGGMTI